MKRTAFILMLIGAVLIYTSLVLQYGARAIAPSTGPVLVVSSEEKISLPVQRFETREVVCFTIYQHGVWCHWKGDQ